jgi:hypothetical protein
VGVGLDPIGFVATGFLRMLSREMIRLDSCFRAIFSNSTFRYVLVHFFHAFLAEQAKLAESKKDMKKIYRK